MHTVVDVRALVRQRIRPLPAVVHGVVLPVYARPNYSVRHIGVPPTALQTRTP
jgi:hypothetical protein